MHSAKQSNYHEITPGSDYVFSHYSGWCAWEPRYELSVTQCNIDVTWFPFDKQTCRLIFISWILSSYNIVLYPDFSYLDHYTDIASSDWTLESAYSRQVLLTSK